MEREGWRIGESKVPFQEFVVPPEKPSELSEERRIQTNMVSQFVFTYLATYIILYQAVKYCLGGRASPAQENFILKKKQVSTVCSTCFTYHCMG